MERCLKSETVHDAEFSKEDDSCSLNLALLDTKFTRVEPKHLGFVVEKFRNDLRLEISFVMQCEVGSVHKDRFLAAMAVNIDKTSNWVGLTSVG